jgi:hypothetical protein
MPLPARVAWAGPSGGPLRRGSGFVPHSPPRANPSLPSIAHWVAAPRGRRPPQFAHRLVAGGLALGRLPPRQGAPGPPVPHPRGAGRLRGGAGAARSERRRQLRSGHRPRLLPGPVPAAAHDARRAHRSPAGPAPGGGRPELSMILDAPGIAALYRSHGRGAAPRPGPPRQRADAQEVRDLHHPGATPDAVRSVGSMVGWLYRPPPHCLNHLRAPLCLGGCCSCQAATPASADAWGGVRVRRLLGLLPDDILPPCPTTTWTGWSVVAGSSAAHGARWATTEAPRTLEPRGANHEPFPCPPSWTACFSALRASTG